MVTDSAGVRFVVNTSQDRPLPVQETLRIGVIEGDPDLQFHRIRAMAVDGEGGVWVTDTHERIRHYSPDGEYVGALGGRGEGPGEAAEGYSTLWAGKGWLLALTYDGVIQLFGSDGIFLGSRPRIAEPGEVLVSPERQRG
jgi:hypothetical protein